MVRRWYGIGAAISMLFGSWAFPSSSLALLTLLAPAALVQARQAGAALCTVHGFSCVLLP